MVKVRKFGFISLAKATINELSIPPLKNAPTSKSEDKSLFFMLCFNSVSQASKDLFFWVAHKLLLNQNNSESLNNDLLNHKFHNAH